MCTEQFSNGDAIEYRVDDNHWAKGVYIGKYPTNEGLHVICAIHGVLKFGRDIRKPKVKKEGYIGIMETRDTHNRWATGIRDTQKEIKELTDRMGSYLISIGKVEWEE